MSLQLLCSLMLFIVSYTWEASYPQCPLTTVSRSQDHLQTVLLVTIDEHERSQERVRIWQDPLPHLRIVNLTEEGELHPRSPAAPRLPGQRVPARHDHLNLGLSGKFLRVVKYMIGKRRTNNEVKDGVPLR